MTECRRLPCFSELGDNRFNRFVWLLGLLFWCPLPYGWLFQKVNLGRARKLGLFFVPMSLMLSLKI